MPKLLTWLGKLLIPLFLERLAAFIKEQYDKRKKREVDSKESKESVQPLKDAETGEQIDAATKKALDDF